MALGNWYTLYSLSLFNRRSLIGCSTKWRNQILDFQRILCTVIMWTCMFSLDIDICTHKHTLSLEFWAGVLYRGHILVINIATGTEYRNIGCSLSLTRPNIWAISSQFLLWSGINNGPAFPFEFGIHWDWGTGMFITEFEFSTYKIFTVLTPIL